MKKIIIGIWLGLSVCFGLRAQSVEYYTFAADTAGGTYESLTGATKLGKSDQIKGELFRTTLFNLTDTMSFPIESVKTMQGIPIGFEFTFDGKTYTHFVAAGLGYILLGTEENMTLDGTDWYEGGIAFVPNPRIGLSTDAWYSMNYGVEETSLAYKSEGTAGNRILSVEFRGMSYAEEAEERFNYQIKLYEEDMRVEFVFDGFETEETNWRVGLNGSFGAHFREPEGNNWCETSYTNSSMICWEDFLIFKEGLKYTFSLPAECEAPTETIEEIALTAFSDKVTVDVFVDTAGYAEGYLIIASEKPITGIPTANSYTEGESVLGGTVLACGPLSDFDRPSSYDPNTREHFTFTHEDLKPNTTYYYAAWLSNFKCTNAKYSVTESASIATLTEAPDTLAIQSIDLDRIVFSAKANSQGEDILIAMTTTKGRDRNRNDIYEGWYGIAPADAKVGDTIWTTKDGKLGVKDTVYSIVIYTGPAGENLECPVELEDNMIYFFGAAGRAADGRYSSVYAHAAVLSPARIPFADRFSNMVRGEDNPFIGWNGTSGFELNGSSSGISGASSTMTGNEAGSHQQAMLALPPLDFPTDSGVWVSVNYSLSPWDVQWVDGDSIVYEVSTDGGLSFSKVKAVHYQSNSKILRDVVLSEYAGAEQAVIRLRAVSYNPKTWNISVSSIKVSGIASCDVPKSVRVNDYGPLVLGGSVPISWSPSMNEESEWNVSYASALSDDTYSEWTEPVSVRERPYYIAGLEDNKLYKVRVRAVCGIGKTSEWVETSFYSGRVPSFTENFDNVPMGTNELELPRYWEHGVLSSGLEPDTLYLDDMISYSHYDLVHIFDWKTSTAAVPGKSNGSMALNMGGKRYYDNNVIRMPAVELLKDDRSKFVFDAAFGKIDENGNFDTLTSSDALVKSHKLAIWASTDSGKTVISNQPLRTWDAAQLAALKDSARIEIDLAGYEGATVFLWGLWGTLEQGNYRLYIDNVGIVNESPVARNLKLESVGETTASISWVADKTVEEWLVKLESADADTMFTTGLHSVEFSGLTPETEYTASVSEVYGIEDTAQWRAVYFKTGGVQCDEVSALSVTNVTKNSASLTWTGSAEKYRVRIRPVSETVVPWAYYTTESTSYELSNLLNETEYEGGVQSICGMASGDTSAYVAFEPFTTLGVTCFAPTDVLIVGTPTHNSAVITWTGEADTYEVEWALRWSADQPLGSMVVTKDTCTITGLKAETRYEVRVRSICAAGDTSDWCAESRNFETGIQPACPAPTDLRVESITATSAELLWSVTEASAGFILRYRSSSGSWDSVKNLTETSYALQGLEPKTAYLWSVMSECTDGRYSGWGTQTRFETEGVGNEATDTEGLYLRVSKGQLYLMNPSAIRIDRVRIYSTTGVLLEHYVLGSHENAILTTDAKTQIVIVEVESGKRNIRFKTLLP